MSEKGVLSKSIANNISEAIIDKLGGTGYAPTEWSKNINLLGIASADIEEALASITEDASSSDKGLLSLSIASDMGAMLNKKYNTSRGFKPSEVSSAVSALIPLPEKTTPSGSIAHITDGADRVPIKSWEVEIAPTLTGKSAIVATQTGRNLLPNKSYLVGANTLWLGDDSAPYYQPLKAGTYTVSLDTTETMTILLYENGSWIDRKYNASTATFVIDHDGSFAIQLYKSAGIPVINNWQLELGSTATTYEPYTAPTTHTASLGRTIYGGTADVVKGEGTENYDKGSMSSTYLSGLNSDYIGYEASTAYFGGHPSVWVRNWNYQKAKARQSGGIGAICNYFPISMHNTTIFSAQYRIYFDVNGKNISSVSDFIAFVQNLEANNESLDILYELNDTYSTDFTFTPITPTPETALGVNNFWADSGDTEVTYRADLDLYEAPSMLLGANNTETEGNEEQEGNE